MIEIKNKELEMLLQVMLNKNIKRIKQNDLDKIEDITLNAKDVLGKLISYDLEDLKLFNNLKTCTIRNYEISNENIDALNNVNDINELKIYNCSFKEKIDLKLNVQTVQFIACKNLKLGNLISKSSIENIFILHCLDYDISNIETKKPINIYFDEVNISNKICEELLKSKIININFNNCDYIDISDKTLSDLCKNKNLVISNENKVV